MNTFDKMFATVFIVLVIGGLYISSREYDLSEECRAMSAPYQFMRANGRCLHLTEYGTWVPSTVE